MYTALSIAEQCESMRLSQTPAKQRRLKIKHDVKEGESEELFSESEDSAEENDFQENVENPE